MSESFFNKLTKQFSLYFSSNVLVTIAGIISYPVWTRVFSQSEYGQMSLASTTLAIFIAFSKFGIQHAALRFYSEFKERKRDLEINYYYTTAFLSVLFFSLLIAAGFIIVIEFALSSQWEVGYLQILRMLAMLIVFDAINSIFLNFLSAEQSVKLHTIITIAQRYLNIALCLLFVLVFRLGLVGFFIGWVLAEGLSAIFLVVLFFVQGKIKPANFSLPLLKESLSYGLPLIGFEVSSVLLATGDRYIIQFYLGSAAVGLYSSAYNLTSYLADFFAVPFRLMSKPLFMSIWEKDGREKTEKFLSTMLKFYCMIAIPIVFAVTFFGRDFLSLLASSKYEQAYIIMPYVIIGYVLYKANPIYAAGLYLKKKTTTMLLIQVASAVLNIGLNFILIPYLGLLAAAINTLVAYLFQVILITKKSTKIVGFRLPFYDILKYMIISSIMILVMFSINNLGPMQLYIRVIAGFSIYCTGIFLVENQIRINIKILMTNFFDSKKLLKFKLKA